jgi:hypothetical protein
MFRNPALIALALLACACPGAAEELSTSILRPTPLDPPTGLVFGKLPGGSGQASYYVSADLSAGDLLTQLRIGPGRERTPAYFPVARRGRQGSGLDLRTGGFRYA